MGYNEKAVLYTILYADLFDYPLTQDEIWKYLIATSQDVTIPKISFRSWLKTLSRYISQKDGFFCIKGREAIIEMRKKCLIFSRAKRVKAKKIAQKLFFIPSISFIGVSGACAVDNASEEDDIDLFIITKEKTLWISRLLILIILQLFGVRRSKNEKNLKDTFCVNMLIDEANLYLGKEREDLYSAHEIVQMVPLFDRNNTYNTFLVANKWVTNFLPNAFSLRTTRNKTHKGVEKRLSVVQPAGQSYAHAFAGGRMVLRFSTLEFLAKHLQLLYMKRHVTNEAIRDGFLAFHPFDYREHILKKFNKKIKQYETI